MKQAGMAAIGLVAALWTTPTQLVSQTPTIDEALRRLGELKAQGRTKGEFETTEQFQGRRSELERRIESLIRGLYAGSGRIGVGAYDADKELFPVTFHGQNLVVHVPRSEAPSFKANASRVDASGKFWIEDDGIAYLAGSASLKIGAKTYRTSRGEPVIRILSTRAVCDVHKGGCWQLVGLALSPDGGKLVAQGPIVGQDGIFSQDVIEVATGWDSRKGLGASFGPVFSPDGRLLGGL